MADETKDCCGNYCCRHCLACYPESTPTLWGLPVVVIPEGIIPPDPGFAIIDMPRLSKACDKIKMVVNDDDGHQNLVKIILERAPQHDAVISQEDKQS